MTTAQTPRPRRSPLARYAPALAAVVVIAIIAVVIGLVSGGKTKKEVTPNTAGSAAFADVPIFYNEAKKLNTLAKYTWQPHCDTATGLVTIPILNPPPCVPALSGSNGGATSPGVTATTIKIGYYVSPPGPYDILLKGAGAYDSPDANAQGYQDYFQIYEHLYELYGRKLQLVRLNGTGPSDDEAAAKADADHAAAEGVFAVVGGPLQARNFQTELAAKKILCLGTCDIASPQKFVEDNAPYIWPISPTPEQTAKMTTAMIKSLLVGKNAVYAGDPKLQKEPRRFALLSYDTPQGEYTDSWNQFYNDLKATGAQVAGHVSYYLNPATLPGDARTIATKLKATGATTIVFTGDPLFPASLTAQMTEQGYFPEWVMSGTVFADTNVFARRFDPRQWSHAFGLQLIPARLPKPQQDAYSVYKWWFGKEPPVQNSYGIIKAAVEQLMGGLQLAGPKLTPETFRDGLWHAPAQKSGPKELGTLVTWGKHGYWPGVDVGGGDNAGVLYWDPNASGADETGAFGKGMYRLVEGGRRYTPSEWATASVKLFDPKGSVTIYPADAIPPELLPKATPVPPDAPAYK